MFLASIIRISEDGCSVCYQDVDQYGTEEDTPVLLRCAHKFRRYCINGWARQQGATLEEVKCPQCNLTAGEADKLTNDLLEATSASVAAPSGQVGDSRAARRVPGGASPQIPAAIPMDMEEEVEPPAGALPALS